MLVAELQLLSPWGILNTTEQIIYLQKILDFWHQHIQAM